MRELALARFWFAGGVALCLIVLVALLVPQDTFTTPASLGDKAQHFIAFGGIAGWFSGVFERRYVWIVAVSIAGFGIVTEYLQWVLTDDRHGDIGDLLADLAGILAAVGAARLGLDQWSAWIERRFGLEYRRTR
ncbi:MAG: VanZ family protein [Pseudomonadota bacterium]